jgi:hypothetical protein
MFWGCFFLFQLFEKLRSDYKNLFGGKPKDSKRTRADDDGRPRVPDFFERWGDEYWMSEVVKDTNLNEDDVWNWNVLRYYNKLSYLKDRGKYNDEQH